MTFFDVEDIKTEAWYESLTYVPLIDPSMISLGTIRKVRFWQDKIFVLYEKDEIRSIHVYDKYGVLLHNRSGIEEGQIKFYRVNDLQVNDDKLYICDGFTSEMHVFNTNLEHIESIKLPFQEGIVSFSFLEDGRALIRPESISSIGSSVIIVDLNSPREYTKVEGLERYSSLNTSEYPLTYVDNFSNAAGKGLIYVDIFRDEISLIGENGSIQNIINGKVFKQIWVSENDINLMENKDRYEQHRYLNQIDKFYYYSHFEDFGDYFYVSFVKYGFRYFLVVDEGGDILKKAKLNLLNNGRNRINGGPVLGNLISSSPSKELVFIQNPEEMKLWNETYGEAKLQNGEYSKMVRSLNEKCQNVLVFVTLKGLER